MDAAVPAIEVAHNTDAPRAGGPDGEVNAADAFECDQVGAEFLVSIVMAALAHQIQIELAEHHGKGIGIEDFEGLAEGRASLNLVTRRGGWNGLARRPGGFEEAFGTKFDGIANVCGEEGGSFNGGGVQRDRSFPDPPGGEAPRPAAGGGGRGRGGEGEGGGGGERRRRTVVPA